MVAEVIVDISSSEIDRIFDYEIGSLDIGAGFRVLVPFGRTETEGYVVAVKEKSEYPNLKPIIRTLDETAVISEEMLSLMDYMTNRYHLRKVDVLRLFIPAQMRGGKVREKTVDVARLLISKDEAEALIAKNTRAPKRQEVIRALMDGPKPLPFLNAISPGAAGKLAALGVLEIVTDQVRRTPYAALSGEREPDPELMPAQQAAVRQLEDALS